MDRLTRKASHMFINLVIPVSPSRGIKDFLEMETETKATSETIGIGEWPDRAAGFGLHPARQRLRPSM